MDEVSSVFRSQLATHPGYSIVTTGASIGGALASLAGITLQQNFPSTYDNSTHLSLDKFIYCGFCQDGAGVHLRAATDRQRRLCVMGE